MRNQTDERTIFTRRICFEKEKKLKEFDFKVLHGILLCSVNLHKSKIITTSGCGVCDLDQLFIYVYNVSMWKERLDYSYSRY